VASQIQKIDGGYLLDGMLAVRDANRWLKLGLPEDESYTTLAGFILARTGHLVRPGEVIEYGNGMFTVESVEKRQIRFVSYTLTEEAGKNNSHITETASPRNIH
jgi:magnesium and cobalt exporter, CNNM family